MTHPADIFLHTHTALAQLCAHRPSALSAFSAVKPDPAPSHVPQMTKYIIAETPTGEPRVILFSKDLQHRDMVPKNLTPVSAGFVMHYEGQITIPQIGSETLSLSPRPQDKTLITQFLNS